MNEEEILKLSVEQLRNRLLFDEEMISKLQKEAVYWNKDATLKENTIKSAVTLCDCIKSVLERFNEFKVRDFKNINKDKLIDMLLISIKDYVDLFMYVNGLNNK